MPSFLDKLFNSATQQLPTGAQMGMDLQQLAQQRKEHEDALRIQQAIRALAERQYTETQGPGSPSYRTADANANFAQPMGQAGLDQALNTVAQGKQGLQEGDLRLGALPEQLKQGVRQLTLGNNATEIANQYAGPAAQADLDFIRKKTELLGAQIDTEKTGGSRKQNLFTPEERLAKIISIFNNLRSPLTGWGTDLNRGVDQRDAAWAEATRRVDAEMSGAPMTDSTGASAENDMSNLDQILNELTPE